MEWSELRSEIDTVATVKRNESEKSDRPLHVVVNNSTRRDVESRAMDSPELGETAPAMLKSEHEGLRFSSEDRFTK